MMSPTTSFGCTSHVTRRPATRPRRITWIRSDTEDELKVVADEDDGFTLVPQAAQNITNLGRFTYAKGSRRLIEDDDRAVPCQHPGDRHCLALST